MTLTDLYLITVAAQLVTALFTGLTFLFLIVRALKQSGPNMNSRPVIVLGVPIDDLQSDIENYVAQRKADPNFEEVIDDIRAISYLKQRLQKPPQPKSDETELSEPTKSDEHELSEIAEDCTADR